MKKGDLIPIDILIKRVYNTTMENMTEQKQPISITAFAASVAESFDVAPPEKAECGDPMLYWYLKDNNLNGIEKAVFYNPSSIGAAVIDRFSEEFEKSLSLFKMPFACDCTASSTCFASMYTGAKRDIHGIRRERSKKLLADTIFDSLARSNKKSAVVALKGTAAARIFINTAADIFVERYDAEAVSCALTLIKQGSYDCIAVFNREYDDAAQLFGSNSKAAIKAIRNHIEAFTLLSDAAEVYWNADTLVGFCPERGARRKVFARGNNISELKNIYHYFGIRHKKI